MSKFNSQFLVERMNQEKKNNILMLAVSDRENHEIHILCSCLLILPRGTGVHRWVSFCSENSNRSLHGYNSISIAINNTERCQMWWRMPVIQGPER